MDLKHLITLSAMTVCIVLPGCAEKRPFPPEAMENVSPTFHFEAWRDAGPSNPSGKSDSGLKVQLGGRIVQAAKNGKGISDRGGTASHRDTSCVWSDGKRQANR